MNDERIGPLPWVDDKRFETPLQCTLVPLDHRVMLYSTRKVMGKKVPFWGLHRNATTNAVHMRLKYFPQKTTPLEKVKQMLDAPTHEEDTEFVFA